MKIITNESNRTVNYPLDGAPLSHDMREERHFAEPPVAHDRHQIRGHHPVPPNHAFPPHIVPNEGNIVFEDSDMNVLRSIFRDEDTAIAAYQIMMQSPPEIKLIFAMQLRIWEKVNGEPISESTTTGGE